MRDHHQISKRSVADIHSGTQAHPHQIGSGHRRERSATTALPQHEQWQSIRTCHEGANLRVVAGSGRRRRAKRGAHFVCTQFSYACLKTKKTAIAGIPAHNLPTKWTQGYRGQQTMLLSFQAPHTASMLARESFRFALECYSYDTEAPSKAIQLTSTPINK